MGLGRVFGWAKVFLLKWERDPTAVSETAASVVLRVKP
jgi:hypothetical protein